MSDWIRDYPVFLRAHVFWWILPPIVLLAGLAAVVFLGSNASVSGFVYNV